MKQTGGEGLDDLVAGNGTAHITLRCGFGLTPLASCVTSITNICTRLHTHTQYSTQAHTHTYTPTRTHTHWDEGAVKTDPHVNHHRIPPP